MVRCARLIPEKTPFHFKKFYKYNPQTTRYEKPATIKKGFKYGFAFFTIEYALIMGFAEEVQSTEGKAGAIE